MRRVNFVDTGVVAILVLSAWFATKPAYSAAGPVAGVIDKIRYAAGEYYVSGWACQEGNHGSIKIHLYANHAANEQQAGTFVISGTADLENEPAVAFRCHDSLSGKHRFAVVLPNQILRTFHDQSLYVHGIAIGGHVENAALAGSGKFRFPKPLWPTDPPTPAFRVGVPIPAFDTRTDSCEPSDIPDAAARAFRDYLGKIHLIASHYITRAGIGWTLETVQHTCSVVYASAHDANPADFDDDTWLNSFYDLDGKCLVALGHMEYHGWEHPGMCAIESFAASEKETASCWYNAETLNLSGDGGYHFHTPKPPANLVLSLPYKYQVNRGPEGYRMDANIVKSGAYYYTAVNAWPWPPGCENAGARSCLVPGGACPIRTSNLLDPSSWRGWDGKAFTVNFADPYRNRITNPEAHICKPVPFIDLSTGINFHKRSRLFIAVLWNQSRSDLGEAGVYFTTSSDFVNWSKPALALTLNQMLRREPEGNWSYQYFSLIDPASDDLSFTSITDDPYLYYVRLDDGHPPYRRVLFRQRVKLNWLFARAARQRL